jgi:putative membrane protein
LTNNETSSPNEVAGEHINLGALNTMMAADRTLMAWIRTSLSFLSFGFAIYKILQEVQSVGKVSLHDNAPRNAGLILIGAGVIAIVMGTIEYWLTLLQLRHLQRFGVMRPALIMALLMCAAGMLLFSSIVIRLF